MCTQPHGSAPEAPPAHAGAPYLQMLEAAPEGVWRLDRDFVTRYVNPYMARLLGVDRSEIEGRPATDFIAADRVAEVKARLERRREGEAERYETEIRRGDGVRIWIRISGAPVWDDRGEFDGSFAIVSDVTERREAEERSLRLTEELERSEERFRLVARAGHEALWEHDLVEDRIWWSESLERLFGHACGVIVRVAEYMEHVHPEDRGWVERSFHQVVDAGLEAWSGNYRFRCADGRYVHVYDRAYVEYREGTPVRAVGAVMDVTERVEALQALRLREREYQTLLESVPDVILRFDRDLRQVYGNPAADRLLHPPGRSTSGLRPSEMGVAPEEAAVWEEALREVFSTGVEKRVVFSVEDPGGPRWFQARIVPERSPDGSVDSVLEIKHEVTDIKRTEEELRRKSHDLEERIHQARCLYAVSDTLTRWMDEPVEEVMERVVALLPDGWRRPGGTRARLELDGTLYATPGFRSTPGSLGVDIGSNGGTRGRIEVACVERHAGEASEAVFQPEEVDLLRAIAQRIDETMKRRAAEEGLARSEAYFRSLIENAYDVISILDRDGTIRYETPAIERLLGVRAGDHVGSHGLDFVHPGDRSRVARTMERGLSRGEDRIMEQYRLVRPDGGVRHVESTAVNLLDDPVVAGLVVTTRDLTERFELERQLQQAQKMEAVGRLAGGVAHDFNNALTVIQGHGELVEAATPPDSPLHDSAREIREAAGRAAHLTRRLLAFSKREMVEPRRVEVNGVVEDLRKMLVRLIGEDLRLVTEMDPDAPVILADAGQIEQVLMNLVVNARDAVSTGGAITLRTRRAECPEGIGSLQEGPPGCLAIEVQDDGAGMSDETAARLFEPFFTTKPDGTGLGLSIVYGIVEQCRGRIEVETAPGRGSTFRIFLPAVRGGAAPEESRPSLRDMAPLHGRVLLVEDEPGVRDLGRTILEQAGLEVVAAALPSEAIALAETGDPIDLLLTDVVMPEMTGQDLADRLRAARPGLVVLFMSGYPQDERVLRTVERDPRSRYLSKPFSPPALLEAVARSLESSPDG